ncbi:ABC transporter transmembrane domain-containing protein [Saccharopolyspora gregorii]|uniref:ABC transporter transmembrane domain-containing protein n=1 Tax=Saccharopolyspora gregorii TaxID=33914 RepID=UPI0021AD3A43|nr:ABC transporter ATP-binding protein [Saccharopolyspora gregorii]
MRSDRFVRPGHPDVLPEADSRSAWRLLWWLVRLRPWPLVAAAALGVCWMVPLALVPLVIGRAIDAGIAHGADGAVYGWACAVFGLGAVQALAGAGLIQAATAAEMHAVSVGHRVLLRHSVRLGGSLREQARTGDVVAITAGDVDNIGDAFEVVGRAIGSLVAFAVVSVVLVLTSPLLGAVALVGVPLAVAGIGPLLRPLQERNEQQREHLGDATARAGDIVAGLRVLRGIGGERRFARRFAVVSQRVRAAGGAAGRTEAWLEAAGVLLPGLVTVVVTWLGARLVLGGVISPGELIAFYGAAAFLTLPVSTATETADSVSMALVAARRMRRVLRLEPAPPPPADPVPLPKTALRIVDSPTGLVVEPGALTVVDAPSAVSGPTAARITRRSAGTGEVTVGGLPIERLDLAQLRRRVVLCTHTDTLFSGALDDELTSVRRTAGRAELTTALHVAAAADVLDSLGGPSAAVAEGGRSLSHGQRQRLVLARAVLADPEVLVLEDPTSAVDAHTEALIVRRLAEHRRGRSTVVFSQSPLWTKAADRTCRLDAEPATATGGDPL